MRRHLVFRSGWYPQYFSGNLNDGQLPPETDSAFKAPMSLPGTGYYYSKNAWNRNFNALGPLCADSSYPSWYGRANNSPGVP